MILKFRDLYVAEGEADDLAEFASLFLQLMRVMNREMDKQDAQDAVDRILRDLKSGQDEHDEQDGKTDEAPSG